MKNYGHLSRRPGRKIGAEKGKKAVCFIFLPTSFCQALFASSQPGSNRELLLCKADFSQRRKDAKVLAGKRSAA